MLQGGFSLRKVWKLIPTAIAVDQGHWGCDPSKGLQVADCRKDRGHSRSVERIPSPDNPTLDGTGAACSQSLRHFGIQAGCHALEALSGGFDVREHPVGLERSELVQVESYFVGEVRWVFRRRPQALHHSESSNPLGTYTCIE
jgi:hypothetical protein